MDITLTPDMQSKAKHAYFQLFSLLSAMMCLAEDREDNLFEVKTLLSMAMEIAGDLNAIIDPPVHGGVTS